MPSREEKLQRLAAARLLDAPAQLLVLVGRNERRSCSNVEVCHTCFLLLEFSWACSNTKHPDVCYGFHSRLVALTADLGQPWKWTQKVRKITTLSCEVVSF